MIEPTAALVAIDMDMATATAGREPKPAKQEAANRTPLPALARHIRLRNLSGAILVDLAGLTQRRRAQPALSHSARSSRRTRSIPACLASRPAAWRRSSVHACTPRCTRCWRARTPQGWPPCVGSPPRLIRPARHGYGLRPTWSPRSNPIRSALPALAHRLGRALVLRSDPALPAGQWIIEEASRG